MVLSVISAILIAASNLILGKHFGAAGMAVGYLTVTIVIIPFVFLIWHHCRNAWHCETSACLSQDESFPQLLGNV